MKRRNFLQCLGFVPLLNLMTSQNTLGMTSGLQPIDLKESDSILKILEDVKPGQLVAIAGRPSMGKSRVALNLVSALISEKNNSCLYYSLEMSKGAVLRRMAGIMPDLAYEDMTHEILNSSNLESVILSLNFFKKSHLLINDESKISIESISSQIKKLNNSGKEIKYVFIDYFNLIHTEQKYLSRRDEVTDILSQLKAIAKRENLIIIALAQLNRGIAGRSSKRPEATDFRETNDLSSIDKLILLHHEDSYSRNAIYSPSKIHFLVYHGHVKSAVSYVGQLDEFSYKISRVKVSNSN